MMEEVWKPIEGYEGIYEVSSLGRVRSLDHEVPVSNSYGPVGTRIIKGRMLKLQPDKHGYVCVGLWRECKMVRRQIHRLVAAAFIPNPLKLPQVNHKNEQKTDNRADNLEWCSAEYNANYGNRSHKISQTRISNAMLGLRVEQLTMDGQHVRTFDSIGEASRVSGADKSVIVRVCKGRYISAGGYRWRYAE